ncbi:MAG: hypothetical protein ACK5MJ_02900 [Alphaproteobacteria bacterium]
MKTGSIRNKLAKTVFKMDKSGYLWARMDRNGQKWSQIAFIIMQV